MKPEGGMSPRKKAMTGFGIFMTALFIIVGLVFVGYYVLLIIGLMAWGSSK